MDPIAPDGCANARHGWAGDPLDTAHLRLRAAQGPHPVELAALALRPPDAGLLLAVEDRLSGQPIGALTVTWADSGAARLGAAFLPAGWQGDLAREAVRRCLRLLFHNFAIELVSADNSPVDPQSQQLFADLGFNPGAAGEPLLSRQAWLVWRAQRPLLLVAAAALIDGDGRVLLARRPPGKAMAGQWEFPGGKLAKGESPESAVIRELKEELALDVSESCLAPIAFASHDYDQFHLLMPLFALRQWSGRPRAQEGQALAWAAKQRLGEFPMPPADIPLVAQLRDWL
jgi:8-oxo-dGTP diphosphatase